MRYVCGFAIYEGCVVLIEKLKGMHTGKLNGIGGKLEKEEDLHSAMVREFKEETNLMTSEDDWNLRVVLRHKNWEVYFFVAKELKSIDGIFKTCDEGNINLYSLLSLQYIGVVPNLQWLIPLCLDTSVSGPMFLTEGN